MSPPALDRRFGNFFNGTIACSYQYARKEQEMTAPGRHARLGIEIDF
jgi:hypothetical protein